MANKIVREIIHAKGIDMILGFTRKILKMNIFR